VPPYSLHRTVREIVASIEPAAVCAASVFFEEGPLIRGQSRESFPLSFLGVAGAGRGGAAAGGQHITELGEKVFLLAAA
jgi:hypothetical protein